MVNIKTLLPDLKELVRDLSEDLLARATENADIDAGLREAFKQIEKGGRTAQAYEVWREDYLDQVAVAWVLACVFVRFMEDNHLIDECWLAGEKERRKLAEDSHELFFRKHPHDTDREYFQHVFREVGKIPAAKDLFAEGKTPLWAVAPSGDAAMKLRDFLREMEPETGELKRSFLVKDGDTRFLGDLYQDLSERARKKYALLQTPVFVEEFILDRTLNPAIDEFGLEKVRMIDPTCGSGHFLLGGFARLFDLWIKRENNEIVAAQKALDGVWGVDINPFAVAIARFRLIVAALQACGIKRLKQAPAWKIHLATGDSLLFGSRWTRSGDQVLEQAWLAADEESWTPDIYACEDRDAIQEVLCQQYHAVVGNPPYIIVRDRTLNAAYRYRYSTCHQKYSLAVPFAERFFDLCITNGNGKSGYVGMITANSFMKREFGKKLIEAFFPKIDLTHVVDTSGAYIPGHGTPTVILFGRNRSPNGGAVRAVLGIKGEPATPDDPSKGKVWQSIARQIDRAGSQDEFTSSTDVARATFNSHPWSIGGGGAAELKEQLDEAASCTLEECVRDIGFMAISGEDDAFVAPQHVLCRSDLANRPFCIGEGLRDWMLEPEGCIAFPYDDSSLSLPVLGGQRALPHRRFFWECRTVLRNRNMFGKSPEEHGLAWFEYMQFIRYRVNAKLSIAFAEVASHNHFVLDRGDKVFKQTAPIVTLRAHATEDDHVALLGLLNSSTACFYMKQVSHQKQMVGGDGVRISSRAKVPYQFAGARLIELPIPAAYTEGVLRNRLRELTARCESNARRMTLLTGAKSLAQGLAGGEAGIRAVFQETEAKRADLRSEMIFLQEEIDFTVYVMFQLADESVLCDEWDWPKVCFEAGVRPFELLQERNVDKFSVPSSIPAEWPKGLDRIWRKRMEAIRRSKDLALIEDDHYKRRWIGRQGLFNQAARKDELKTACANWLLDRLESICSWPDTQKKDPALQTTAQLADKASADYDFMQVASLYRGRPGFDVAALVAELVTSEAVPFLPNLRYKPSGLRKRTVWEQTWDLQRQQDELERQRTALDQQLKDIRARITKLFDADYATLRTKEEKLKEECIRVRDEYAPDVRLEQDWSASAIIDAIRVERLKDEGGAAFRSLLEIRKGVSEFKQSIQSRFLVKLSEDMEYTRVKAAREAIPDDPEIPVPPKYVTADFKKNDCWRLRGKLDVPKERWISYPRCSTDADPTLLVGWAGWDHLQQATALVHYYDARKRDGWDAKRLTPLLAGLDQLLPWIHQWHPEIDKEFGETAGQSFQTMLEHDAHELGLTLEDIRNWQPVTKSRNTRRTRNQKG